MSFDFKSKFSNIICIEREVYEMSEFNTQTRGYASDSVNAYLVKVFSKMGLGLLVTAIVAALSYYTNAYYYYYSMTGGMGTIILVIAQLGVVMGLSTKITTMQTSSANLLFLAYSALTGFTFSTLLYVYSGFTVFGAFAFTAVLFGSCAVIGATTHRDLSQFSTLFMGGIIALVVASIASMFIPALRDSLLISYVGILLFLGITAWDMQKIKSMYYSVGGYGQLADNLAIYGAFSLYLDFINIFLYVIRILGSRNDN